MTREELEIEYSAAWEALQQARMNVQFAQKNFHDVCGLLMEKLMLENVDVLARLKAGDTPTIYLIKVCATRAHFISLIE